MPQVVVLGAGVIGLSTAIRAQQAGHTVTIVAEILPGDSKTPDTAHYASPWAGARHISDAEPDDMLQLDLDRETFLEFWRMSEEGSPSQGCFLRLQHTNFYGHKQPRPMGLETLGCMPEFRHVEEQELIEGAEEGISFLTVTINTSIYLPYLLATFLGAGGRVVRTRVQHIDQIGSGAVCPAPDAVFICTGLGARFLGGVEDTSVYPIRGQTVLIHAPWVTFARGLVAKNGSSTYIIPRKNGDVFLGGTQGSDDWYHLPRPEEAEDILHRALAMMPELAPPDSRAGGRTPTLEDLKGIVIEHGCGFRPKRRDGIRLDREWRNVPRSEKKVVVIHNYGHGGQGYQSSWGSASKALALLDEWFRDVNHVQV